MSQATLMSSWTWPLNARPCGDKMSRKDKIRVSSREGRWQVRRTSPSLSLRRPPSCEPWPASTDNPLAGVCGTFAAISRLALLA